MGVWWDTLRSVLTSRCRRTALRATADRQGVMRMRGMQMTGLSLRRGFLTTLLVAFLAACATAEAGRSEEPIAFTNVNVVPMDRERILADHTVVVANGRIEEVGPAAHVQVPEGSRTIDSRGKYLMPGLADMHVHPVHPDQLLLFLANGVTTIRNMHGGPKYLEWKKRITDGKFLAPFVYTTGPFIDGKPDRGIPGGVLVDTPQEARRAVIDQKTAGYDHIKVLGGLSRETYDAVIDEAAKQGLQVVGHVPPAVGLDHVVRAGQRSIEHMDGIAAAAQKDDSPLTDSSINNRTNRKAYYEAWKHINVAKVRRIAEALVAKGTWVCPTLVPMQSDPMPDEVESFLQRPEVRFVWPETIEYWKAAPFPEELVQVLRDGIEGRMLAVKSLHETGVRLVLGTDSPAGFVLHGFGTLRELEILVEAALTPYEAIEMATRNAAELVGASDEFGTVAVGRRADLILLEANPLNDVSNVAKRAGVMVRGRWYTQAELDAKLDSLAEKYAKETSGAGDKGRGADDH